jgi:hypothetical protein
MRKPTLWTVCFSIGSMFAFFSFFPIFLLIQLYLFFVDVSSHIIRKFLKIFLEFRWSFHLQLSPWPFSLMRDRWQLPFCCF